MAAPLDSGQRPCEQRTHTTRQRHGDDFYARIGRRSWAVRRQARTGDADMLTALELRRRARRDRPTVWADLLAAREATTLLREELASRLRADDQRAWRGAADAAGYRAALRAELAQAERRLAGLIARHGEVLAALAAPLPADMGDHRVGGEGAGG